MLDTIRIQNDVLTVTVSSAGSETQSIETKDGRSWLWNGDPAFWSSRSPILFPIVGKAPGDYVEIDEKNYPMQQHGFARHSVFELVEQSATSCRLELTASNETRKAYPFDFRLSVTHAIIGRRLTVTVTVENRDKKPMPFGFGFHPAFRWPIPGMTNEDTHHISLENGAEPTMIRLRDGLLDLSPRPSPFSKGRLALKYDDFVEDAMIFPEGAGERLTLSAKNGTALHFVLKNLPNLALWTKPDAPYICVEPWHGMAAVHGKGAKIEHRPFTQILPPNDSVDFSFSVEIKL